MPLKMPGGDATLGKISRARAGARHFPAGKLKQTAATDRANAENRLFFA